MQKIIISVLILLLINGVHLNQIPEKKSNRKTKLISNPPSTIKIADSALPDELDIANPSSYHKTDQRSHELILSKIPEKEPYKILEKLPDDGGDDHTYPDIDVHPESFDFNLDDLEDVHQTFAKGDLNPEEIHLLRDASKLQYDEVSVRENSTPPLFVDSVKNIEKKNLKTPILTLPDAFNSSRHIYKVTKNSKDKSKSKGRELLKSEGVLKSSANQFNSVNNYLVDSANMSSSDAAGSQINYFQLLVNLFDHFHWKPSEIRTRVSPVCGVELLSYLSALHNNYEWAQRAYDSSGRYRGQFHFGNDLWLGEKMFCEEINYKNHALDINNFEVGFFVARVVAMLPTGSNMTNIIQVGQCLPKSCTINDIHAVLDIDPYAQLFANKNSTKKFLQILGVRRVPTEYKLWADKKFQVFCGFSITLLVIIIWATIVESSLGSDGSNELPKTHSKNNNNNNNTLNGETNKVFELHQMSNLDNNNLNIEVDAGKIKTKIPEKQDDGILESQHQIKDKIRKSAYQKILLCFAFGSNASTILSVERNHEDSISCVHGIRVFSLLWTIMVHTYLQLFSIGENRFRRAISERTFSYQVIGNATFSVDSFFFISGLLVTLIFLKHEKKKEPENNNKDFIKKGLNQGLLMVFYRYIRLTPAYIFVIVFNQISLKYIFDRSVFQPTVTDNITCAIYWWRNILYINNWFPLPDLCMVWSWYLANDMQFYILAIALLIMSKKYFNAATITLFIFLITSWGTSGLSSLHHRYTHKVANPFESFDFLYDKPWQRIGSHIIGMITGYILYKTKTPPRIPFVINLTLWIISTGILFIIIFGVWEGQLNILATAFYVSVGHTAWGLGLVWITLSCSWGLSPAMNKMLSYRGFLPLSRLTYCTYLVHPVIMIMTAFQMEGPIHLDHAMILTVFLGNAVLSFIVAFIISVSFEAPVIRLLKLFLRQ